MNRKEDYIQILEFGKDVTENMKWKGNSKITTFFQKLYSQTNFDNAIKIINKKDETSRNIIGAIQKIEGLIISGKYKTIIQFLINQLNNKNLRDSDVLKALENRLKREPTESNNLKPFKFKGGKSKKNKKRGMKKTRKNIKRGGFPSFLSSLNPFNILRSRSAVVPTDTDEIDLDLELYERPEIPVHELQDSRIPFELNDFSNIFFFNSETGNYQFTQHGNTLPSYRNNSIEIYRDLIKELNSKKLNCESILKTGFKFTRWTLFISGILLGITSTALMPMGLLGVFSVGLLFAALFGLPISGAIISGAILSVEDYIIDKYCIHSAIKRNTKRDAELGERRYQFQHPVEVQREEEEVMADAFDPTPVDVPNSNVKIKKEEEKEEEEIKEEKEDDDNNNNHGGPFPLNKFYKAIPVHQNVNFFNPENPNVPIILNCILINQLIL